MTVPVRMIVVVRRVGVNVIVGVVVRVQGRGVRGRFCCLHPAIIRGVSRARPALAARPHMVQTAPLR